MPKRATLTFSSDDAPNVESEDLFVYYCKFSGRHAMTANCDLRRVPRRRTDNSAVIDTQRYKVRLYATGSGAKLIKRKSGAIERQFRLNLGKLPVAYRSEEDGRFLYVLDGALTTYGAGQAQADGSGGEKTPVPPCILRHEPDGCQIAIEVEDRADKASALKLSADYVRVEITGSITATDSSQEILELLRTLLSVRLGQLSLARGQSTRHKLVLVEGMTPEAAFEKLQKALGRGH